jgi:hypothetical protein
MVTAYNETLAELCPVTCDACECVDDDDSYLADMGDSCQLFLANSNYNCTSIVRNDVPDGALWWQCPLSCGVCPPPRAHRDSATECNATNLFEAFAYEFGYPSDLFSLCELWAEAELNEEPDSQAKMLDCFLNSTQLSIMTLNTMNCYLREDATMTLGELWTYARKSGMVPPTPAPEVEEVADQKLAKVTITFAAELTSGEKGSLETLVCTEVANKTDIPVAKLVCVAEAQTGRRLLSISYDVAVMATASAKADFSAANTNDALIQQLTAVATSVKASAGSVGLSEPTSVSAAPDTDLTSTAAPTAAAVTETTPEPTPADFSAALPSTNAPGLLMVPLMALALLLCRQ